MIPAGIWCQNDVVSTSMRRDHVASTLTRRHFTSCARWDRGSFPESVTIRLNFVEDDVALRLSAPERNRTKDSETNKGNYSTSNSFMRLLSGIPLYHFKLTSAPAQDELLGYCDVRRTCGRPSVNCLLVYTLEGTFLSDLHETLSKRFKIFLKFRSSSKLGHIGSKTRSLGQMFGKLVYTLKGTILSQSS